MTNKCPRIIKVTKTPFFSNARARTHNSWNGDPVNSSKHALSIAEVWHYSSSFFTAASTSKLHLWCITSDPLHAGGGNTRANRGWKAISATTGSFTGPPTRPPGSHWICGARSNLFWMTERAWGATMREVRTTVSPADSVQAQCVWTSYGSLRSRWVWQAAEHHTEVAEWMATWLTENSMQDFAVWHDTIVLDPAEGICNCYFHWEK